MPKREARLEREANKKLKQASKSARLRERPAPIQEVRLGADPGSIFQMHMKWSCDDPDCGGEWSWGTPRQWRSEDWENVIRPKLNEWAKLLWREIDQFSSDSNHKMHHLMLTDDIVTEAQSRMVEIEKFEDQIFRFRLGNKRRLWGHRVVNEFQIIWYDPNHEIYPTDPD